VYKNERVNSLARGILLTPLACAELWGFWEKVAEIPIPIASVYAIWCERSVNSCEHVIPTMYVSYRSITNSREALRLFHIIHITITSSPSDQHQVEYYSISSLSPSIEMPHSLETQPGVVEAFLEYYAPNSDGSLPDANDLEVQYGKKNLDLRAVKINDMRSRPFKLDEDGFTLIKHESEMTDFTNREKVKAEYYPEVAEAIKKAYV
jgi:hypothetical protein